MMNAPDARSDSRSRLIAARPAAVFAAMSDPERVARWWGPAGFTSTIHREEIAQFVSSANEQNLERLAAEVARGKSAA